MSEKSPEKTVNGENIEPPFDFFPGLWPALLRLTDRQGLLKEIEAARGRRDRGEEPWRGDDLLISLGGRLSLEDPPSVDEVIRDLTSGYQRAA